jgi:uncharacterized protein (TIGR02145 family)
MAAKTDWNSSSEQGDVGNDLSLNNSSGFSALPGGYRYSFGSFHYVGISGSWWSSTESNASAAYYRGLSFDGGSLGSYYGYKEYGFSARLVRD